MSAVAEPCCEREQAGSRQDDEGPLQGVGGSDQYGDESNDNENARPPPACRHGNLHDNVTVRYLTLVNLLSQNGIHTLPSTDNSNLSTQLARSAANTPVPLTLACFPPRDWVPENDN